MLRRAMIRRSGWEYKLGEERETAFESERDRFVNPLETEMEGIVDPVHRVIFLKSQLAFLHSFFGMLDSKDPYLKLTLLFLSNKIDPREHGHP